MDIIVRRNMRVQGVDYVGNTKYSVTELLGNYMVNSGFADNLINIPIVSPDSLTKHNAEHNALNLYRKISQSPVGLSAKAYAFGDSISQYTVNHGASDAAHMWTNLFKTEHTEYPSWTELAISGGTVYEMMTGAGIQTAFNPGDLCVGLLGVNDLRTHKPLAQNKYDLERYMQAYLAFLAVPEIYKVRAVNIGTATKNPSITTNAGIVATLAGISAGGFSTVIYNSSQGANDSISFSVPAGDTLYLWVWKGSAIYPNSIVITVDGDSVTSGGYYDSVPMTGHNWFPALIRITGLANTTHTVTLKTPNASVPFIFQCAACFDSSTVTGTNVIVGNTLPQAPLSTAWGTGQYPAPSGAGTASSTGITVTGTSTLFNQQAGVGWLIANAAFTQIKSVIGIASDTSLTTDSAFSPALSAEGYKLISPDLQRSYQRGAADNYWTPIVKKIATELSNDGLNVFYADVQGDFDVNGHLYSGDLIHPNDQGHLHIANVVQRVFNYGN